MPTQTTLIAFCAATLVFVTIPGPNLLYIVGHGVTGGRRQAVSAVLGVEIGTMIHIAASALGLSAILSQSTTAFTTVKYLGVVYLAFLGIRAIRTSRRPKAAETLVTETRPLLRGIVVNVLNPEAALFFLAFFPQFIDPARNALGQTFTLGLVMITIAIGIDLLYATGASCVADRLANSSRTGGRFIGSIYLLLAGVAVVSGGRPTGV